MENLLEHYGIWSLLPPLVAIILAFRTKQVIPSLFAAILVGATIIYKGNVFMGFAKTIEKYIAGSVASEWNAGIIVFDIGLGGMIGIVAKSGGAKAIAEWLGEKARSAKSAMVATWAMGLAIFFDDYSNTLLVGTTMRPLTDKRRISREKLAFLTDATAAPVASMALISTWIAYELGLLNDALASIGFEMNAYEAFVKSIPFRFYSIIMLGFVLMIAITGRDYGPMLKAERRARKTGKLVADGSTPLASKELTEMEIKEDIPLRAYNAIIPVLTVIVMVIVGLYINGRGAVLGGDDTELINALKQTPFAPSVLRQVIGNANAAVAMMWASFCGSIVAFALVLGQKILNFKEAMEAWIDGAKSLIIAIMVLVLAWGIGSICKDLGTAKYLVGILEGKVAAGIIPMAVFILGCIIAFSTGTSWGTTAILMPIAVPLVYQLSGGDTGTILFATIGAVFTGAVFGDHCSPISDTTIMSSMSAASDHIDHVKTQIPYSLTVAIIALLVGYIPAAVLGINPWISLFVGLGLSYLVIKFYGKEVEDPEFMKEVEENIIT
ncbi:Na+/H+ antiporter NhaC family protein [Paramaledivibacter caminithermalis]|uniref:Transporter, NhaC family (TC 2.A.35) n=1 Tax=Paramaledivibacter caminithermalis (strain DSM 15212 / CIP 107654 / DViRD3) TaxID=1121301 RepID=A0A1M6TMR2_PARC5|nr:Na+/H+ antiporter NhaC family protein [Paramaledivibacter caminithermalis]SHK58237.1 transporter, NhaC family (TC 2.A.35) [Paramaledivibacter caminithermalis DSM 15212]